MLCFHLPARLAVALLFLCVCIIFPVRASFAADSVGNITGLVLDQSTGNRLSGASVKTGAITVVTDAAGKYTLTGVPISAQTVTASASLYKPASITVTVSRNATVTAPPLTLAPNWGNVSGTVTNSNGAGIANATLAVSGTSLSTLTNSAGAYTLSKVPAGAQTLTASVAGYASVSQNVVVTNGGAPANFTLIPLTILTGPGNTIPWEGNNLYLAGNNFAWQNYGTDFGSGGWGKFTNTATIGQDFQAMRAQGVKVVRWWVFGDGRYSPKFGNPAADTAVTGLDGQFFVDVDSALKMAHDNNIYLMPCLVDFYMFTTQQTMNGVYGGGHGGILSSPAIQQSYLDKALKPFLQHVAASPYKNSVLAYDICNEIEFVIGGLGGGGSTATIAQEQTFLRNCATYIHIYGGGSYATAGSAEDAWVGYMRGTGLDFYQIHWYPNFTGRGLPTYTSLNLDRPCIVGEFPTNNGDFAIGSTGYFSAQWFLDTIYNQGYAGALGWGYGSMDGQCNWDAFYPVFANWTAAKANTPSLSGAATPVKIDTATQGNWKGVYGRDGYHVIGDTVNTPAYDNGWGSGMSSYTWAGNSANIAALQKPGSDTDRIAACWYSSTTFLADLNLTDGLAHPVAFYFLDYDKGERTQSVEVLDANTNAVLQTQSLSNFSNGVYLIYNLKGHVKVRVTNTAGTNSNCVLSGIFFN